MDLSKLPTWCHPCLCGEVTLQRCEEQTRCDEYGNQINEWRDETTGIIGPPKAHTGARNLDDRDQIVQRWTFYLAPDSHPTPRDRIVFCGCCMQLESVEPKIAPCGCSKLSIHHYEVTAVEVNG